MIRRLVAIVPMWIAAGAAVYACPVCFQFEDGATTAGVRAALIVLLSVTVIVLSTVAAWGIRRRTSLFSSLAVSPGSDMAQPAEKSNDPL